jgi:hypothetical protein
LYYYWNAAHEYNFAGMTAYQNVVAVAATVVASGNKKL